MTDIIQYPDLYKLDSNGRRRQWRIEREGPLYRTVAGLENGSLVVSQWTTAKVKNAGRSNASTPETQAEIEAEAAYEKKRKEGYAAEGEKPREFFQPMTAKVYTDRLHMLTGLEPDTFKYTMYSQPKMDGIRSPAPGGSLFSRTGERFISCPHLEIELRGISERYGAVMDGELYNHELRDDFEEIASLVRKEKDLTVEDFAKTEKIIQFHAYDCYFPKEPKLLFSERHVRLLEILDTVFDLTFVTVPTVKLLSPSQAMRLYDQYLDAGYEGQMVRIDAPYEKKKKSSMLLKQKDTLEDEFLILDVIEGEGNRSGMAGAYLLAMPDGTPFKAGIKGGFTKFKEIWETREQRKGKWATVEFHKYTGANGVPRHGRVKDPDRRD